MMKTEEVFKELLRFIDERLEREHMPDLDLVKEHNADPLNKDWQVPEGALWEQSGVVHDLLAFLAEQMIELNKQKQKEIQGFLGWVERKREASMAQLRPLKVKIQIVYKLYGLGEEEVVEASLKG